MYQCPSCNTDFDSIQPGSGFRSVSTEWDRETLELLCPSCGLWSSASSFKWTPSQVPVDEDDDSDEIEFAPYD